MTKTCFQIDAKILWQKSYDGDQNIIRLKAPKIAEYATAGSFLHIQCDKSLKMRRPISIMRVDKTLGTVDLLFKILGAGTKLLAEKQAGDFVNILGPIGQGFSVPKSITKPLLIGGGVGMPPMIFLAETLKNTKQKPLVILGSEVPFPFKIEPSTIMVDGIDEIGTMPLLNDWAVAGRLASLQNYEGVFNGFVTDLADKWLKTLDETALKEVAIYSCGPHPMLEAVHKLSVKYNLPCQVSLEEFMACGIGGCAGCVVEVKTDKGVAMRRVCVDGPVFESADVFNDY